MRLRYKVIFSVVMQVLLFALVPPLLTRAGLRAANWVRVWEYISDHEFFSSTSRDRVVLLGDSALGTRYCNVSPDVAGAPVDDNCTVRSAMQFQAKQFPNLSRFSYFDFTTNGTLAEAHLYYFLLMLAHGGSSMKYLIYTLPGKLTLNLHDRSYYVLNEQAANLIDSLPPELQTEKLRWLAKNYRDRLETFSREQQFFHERDRYRRFREIFWAHRSFVQDLLGDLRDRFAPEASEVIFNTYLEKESATTKLSPVDQFHGQTHDPLPEMYFKTERDFLFLDILTELCERVGITVIFYIPPNRTVCPPTQLEPCDSNIFRPILARYHDRPGVTFLDHRRDPYLVPRDSPDGIHPSLHSKMEIATELLHAISETEEKKPR
jgi:hypothetical protein